METIFVVTANRFFRESLIRLFRSDKGFALRVQLIVHRSSGNKEFASIQTLWCFARNGMTGLFTPRVPSMRLRRGRRF